MDIKAQGMCRSSLTLWFILKVLKDGGKLEIAAWHDLTAWTLVRDKLTF